MAYATLYLRALAYLQAGDQERADQCLQKIMAEGKGEVGILANGLHGKISFDQRKTGEALESWKKVPQLERKTWGLEEPLQKLGLMLAIDAIREGDFEKGQERLAEARSLGCREPAISPLMIDCLIKAGQKVIEGVESTFSEISR
jgi:predicted Zn-dependent protease